MSKVKGFDILIKAWVKVHSYCPDWKLKIYGKSVEKEILVKLIQDLNLSKVVALYDPVTNIQEKYLASSLYVLSSRYEGFGMVLLEAMSCGIPCISFDCPYGPRDIIRDGIDGILVEKENIELLADAIIKLMIDNDLRKSMGQEALNNVEKFKIDQIAKQWNELFHELIKCS
ncbi:MAG: glycosyltransferase [Bacteroides sp.]|nr:glycosyltransferase [Bacteroides sp.]